MWVLFDYVFFRIKMRALFKMLGGGGGWGWERGGGGREVGWERGGGGREVGVGERWGLFIIQH